MTSVLVCFVQFYHFSSIFFIVWNSEIGKEIDNVNKKRNEEEVALLNANIDSPTSKRIKQSIFNLEARQKFLHKKVLDCNDAMGRDSRQLKNLKTAQRIDDNIKMDWT